MRPFLTRDDDIVLRESSSDTAVTCVNDPLKENVSGSRRQTNSSLSKW